MAKHVSKARTKLYAPCVLLIGCVLSASIGLGMVANTFAVSADTSSTNRTYTSSYSSKDEVSQAALDLNEKIAEEGMVLFENDGALPLKTSMGKKTKVTVFGYNAASPAVGGDQSMDDTSSGVTTADNDVYEILENVGYSVNPTVRSAYKEWKSAYSSDKDIAAAQDAKTIDSWDDMSSSFKRYGDAAIVVLGTTGYGTGSDSYEYRYKYDENGSIIGTALTLDDEQLALVEMAAKNFNKVIVVINTATPVEMGELDDMYQDGEINAIIQCSEPGNGGLAALGSLLKGDVSPSGHTGDIWARDFSQEPSFINFTYQPYVSSSSDDSEEYYPAYFEEYEEGIYVGYRYYETVAYEMNKSDTDYGTDGDSWYADQVVYPFGYGLSYTDFDYEVVSSDVPETVTASNVNDTMTVKVKVTNTGDYAGKAVVQLYYESPYTDYDKAAGVEKSYVVLGDYSKTDTLQPGASEVVDVMISAADMASYDENGAKTYILDNGTYNLKVMTDSHTEVCEYAENMSFTVSGSDSASVASDGTTTSFSGILVNTSSTGAEVTNQFDESTEYMQSNTDQLSRADMAGTTSSDWDITKEVSASKPGTVVRGTDANGDETWVSVYTEASTNSRYLYKDKEDEFNAGFTNYTFGGEDNNYPWWDEVEVADEDMPTYADEETRPESAEVVLSDLIGLDYDDPLWDTLLDELSLDEMTNLIYWGGYYTYQIDYIGKPYARDTDGPKGWTGSGTGGLDFPKMAAEPMIACTWNTELLYELGIMIGEEGLWGNSDSGSNVTNYTGWYAPGINTHRSPFDSRYEEYYSEDGYLAGTLAAAITTGAQSMGVYVYLKHLVCYEDGNAGPVTMAIMSSMADTSEKSGMCVWADEQTMREIYLKPFQIGIEEGHAHGAMVTFDRIGTHWVGSNYGLLTNVLRKEWGFEGIIVSDIVGASYFDANALIYAGGNLMLTVMTIPRTSLSEDYDASEVAAMREACHGILYATANSSAMQTPYGAAVNISASDIAGTATLNEAYTGSVTADVNTVYKYSDVTFSITEGSLPDGLSINAATGEISGTPTKAGTYTFTVTASATDYTSASQSYTIVVGDGASYLTSDDLSGIQSDISSLQTDVANLGTGSTDSTTTETSSGNGLAIAGLVIGCVGVVAAAAAIGIVLLRKKSN